MAARGLDSSLIHVAKPWFGAEETKAVSEVLASGWVTQGPKVAEFEKDFSSYTGAGFAVAASNCTTALHLTLTAVGVKPGDIVICPSYSFIATANAIRQCGAEPYFVDVRWEDLNLDPSVLRSVMKSDFAAQDGQLRLKDISRFRGAGFALERIDSKFCGRLAAVLCVHQIGLPADLKSLKAICDEFKIPLVEDAACGAGSRFQIDGKFWKIGQAFGEAACFSFHPRKLVVTGDGGMITTQRRDLADRLRILRQHGMTATDLERHKADGIVFESYAEAGFNYRMTDLQAAVGIVQLARLDESITKRRALADQYREHLSGVRGLRLISPPSEVFWNHQTFQVQLPDGVDLRHVMTELKKAGIDSRRGVMCAHLEVPYEKAWKDTDTLSVSERLRSSGLTLPLYAQMTGADVASVSSALVNILAGDK